LIFNVQYDLSQRQIPRGNPTKRAKKAEQNEILSENHNSEKLLCEIARLAALTSLSLMSGTKNGR
jgi:hypothetical protein